MQRLLPSVVAAFFVLTGNAWAEEPQKTPAQIKLEFTQSLDRMKKSLSKCWRPHRNFKGSLSFNLTLEKDGKIRNIMRFVGSKNDTADERRAIAAIKSCQPYVVPPSYRNWDDLDVVLARHVEIFSHADMRAPTAKPTLTSEEIAKLRKQVAACTKTSDFESETELELHLNRDGSVAPSSKIISAATQEIGRNILDAAVKCQPYSLPAEKYDVWKAMILVFVSSKRT